MSRPAARLSAQWLQASPLERQGWAAQARASLDVPTLEAMLEASLLSRSSESRPVSPHTIKTYQKGVRHLSAFLSKTGGLTADRLPFLEQEYVDAMTAQQCKNLTIHTRVAALRQLLRAFQWAGMTLPRTAPAQSLPDYRVKSQKRAFTEDEIALLLRHADVEERVIVLLGWELGLKPAEMVRLRPGDLEYGQHTRLHVSGHKESWVLPVPGNLLQALNHWLGHSGNTNVAERQTGRAFLLPGRQPDYVAAVLRRLCQRTGVNDQETGVESLRLAAGRRIHQQTGDAEQVRLFLRMRSKINLKPYLA